MKCSWGKAKVGFCPLQAVSLQILEAGTVTFCRGSVAVRLTSPHSRYVSQATSEPRFLQEYDGTARTVVTILSTNHLPDW